MKNEVNKESVTNLGIRSQIIAPPLYQVHIHNDDFTPMEFVIAILEKFFFMERAQAADTMFKAHQQGMAKCGLFTKEYAESKIVQVIDYARLHEHPLICSMEAVW